MAWFIRLPLPRADGLGKLAASRADVVAAALERAQLLDDAIEPHEAMLDVVAALNAWCRSGRIPHERNVRLR
jgi:hypothetical protein